MVIALFIEDIVIGQVVFHHLRRDLAALQDEIAVERLVAARQWSADADRGAIRAILRQLRQDLLHIGGKCGFAHQILQLVAGQKHLGKGDHIRACGLGLRPSGLGLRGIATQIAHGGVELCKA